jgi:uncharacterized protein (DUF2147 family)
MLLLLAPLLAQAPDQGLAGTWSNPKGSVVVLIAPCGEGLFCGKVQWASEKAQADTRRGGGGDLVGSELLHNFAPTGLSRWRGTLFVPDLNRRSKAEMVQVDADHIRVRGCAVGGLICKSEIWTRTARPEDGVAKWPAN